MRTWAVRILGLANTLYCLAGILYFIAMLSLHWHKWSLLVSKQDWLILGLLSAICVSLVSLLGYVGIRLLRGDETALRLCIILFAAETAYLVADVVVFWMVLPSSMAAVTLGVWEVAEDVMAPQLVTAYPLLGIIICLILLCKSSPATLRARASQSRAL